MSATPANVTVVDHPLVQHKLTLLRRKDAPTTDFRRLAREVSLLLAYEVMRDLPLEMTAIETPLEAMHAPVLSGKKLCFISILRRQRHPRRHAAMWVSTATPRRCRRRNTTSRCPTTFPSAWSWWSTPCWPRATPRSPP
jgi:hypothetical protein